MTTVEAPIKLKTQLPETFTFAQLERYVNVAGNQVRRRAKCPIMDNQSDPELACRVYEEFVDLSGDQRLHLNTGPLKFEFWRQVLSGQARAHWDAIVTGLAGTTNDDFRAGIQLWFGNYFEVTAFHDQKQYFLQASKAYSMSVRETATRIEEIMRYMRFMPGAPADAATPVYSETEKKMTLYRLMRPNWKTNFDASGADITADAYTWAHLIQYFSAQERRENRVTRTVGGRGGRVPSRGGRGGRGGYGRTRRYEGGGGGGPPKRFRDNGGGYHGRGYGYGHGFGRGYGYAARGGYHFQGGDRVYQGERNFGPPAGRGPPGRGRGPPAGRGGRGGGRMPGRGRFPGRLTATHTRAGYPRRTGAAYFGEESEVHQVESFESGVSNPEVSEAAAAVYQANEEPAVEETDEFYGMEGVEYAEEYDYDVEDVSYYGDY